MHIVLLLRLLKERIISSFTTRAAEAAHERSLQPRAKIEGPGRGESANAQRKTDQGEERWFCPKAFPENDKFDETTQ